MSLTSAVQDGSSINVGHYRREYPQRCGTRKCCPPIALSKPPAQRESQAWYQLLWKKPGNCWAGKEQKIIQLFNFLTKIRVKLKKFIREWAQRMCLSHGICPK